MVSENPALAQYVSSTQENGKFVLTLDEQGFKNAVESVSKPGLMNSGYPRPPGFSLSFTLTSRENGLKGKEQKLSAGADSWSGLC